MAINHNILRSRLEKERKRLLDILEQARASAASEERREGSPFGKREEEAAQSSELEKRLALEKQVKDNLAEIEHALAKFDKGNYGMCDICNKPIDPARLEALPHANLCLACKAAQGKNSKGK